MLKPRNPRYETLDAWRGLACLLVVICHSVLVIGGNPDTAPPTDHGGEVVSFLHKLWIGVPLFFVISGYCVAAAADSARRRPRGGRSFFARRFRRIYPPMWAFLALCVVAHVGFMWVQSRTGLPLAISHRDPFDVSAVSWLGSVTLTEEWRLNVFGPPRDYFQWHLWTLCYEEQFYLVTGLVVVFAPRRLFEAVAAISLLVFLILIDVVRPPFEYSGFFFDGAWLEFAAGVAVYHRRNYATRFTARLIDLGLLLSLIWIARSVSDWASFKQSMPTHLAVAFAAALLISLGQRFDAVTARARVLWPLRWCGLRCYSLYLIHGPVVYVTSRVLLHIGWTSSTAVLVGVVPVCVAASLVTGWLFHRTVEALFLNAPIDTPQPDLAQTPAPVGQLEVVPSEFVTPKQEIAATAPVSA